jgi:hypothetical protein
MSEQPETESALLLRGYELRLLRCTLASSSSDSPPHQPAYPPSDQTPLLHALINDILASIESGDYLRALSSDAARLVVQLAGDSHIDSAECTDQVYSESLDRVESFISQGNESEFDDEDRACRVVLVMCVAVSAFLGFTQCNVTGLVRPRVTAQ